MREPRAPATQALSLLLACSLSILPAAPALAGEAPASATAAAPARLPTLVVVPVPIDDAGIPLAARLGTLGEQVANRLGRHQLLRLTDLLDPDSKTREQKAQEAIGRIGAARKAYDDLDLASAIAHCDAARSALEKTDLSRHFEDFIQAWILRVASLLANAEQKAAKAELALLLPLDSKSSFDPTLFAPDFIAQVKKAREELRTKSNQPLDVSAKGGTALVFVDGAFRGQTPLELRDLSPGEHLVTLVAPGFQLVQGRARPGAGAAFSETLNTTPKGAVYRYLVEKLRKGFAGPDRAELGRDLAQELGVDQVLLLGVAGKGDGQLQLSAVRVGAKEGRELGTAEGPVSTDEARFAAGADSLLSRGLGADQQREPDKKVAKAEGSRFEWKTRYTGYVLAGAGAAALVSGVLFGLSARGAAAEYRERSDAQTNSVYSRLEASGRRSALVADLSFLAALVAGGAGGYLLANDAGLLTFLQPNPSAEEKHPEAKPRHEGSAAPAKLETPPPAKPADKPIDKPAEKKVEEPKPEPKPAAVQPKAEEKKPEPKKSEVRKPEKPSKPKEETFDDLRDD